MVRIGHHRDLPRHFEASLLASWVQAVGWPLALLLVAGSISLVVDASSRVLEALGALLALAATMLVVGLVRCRRYEITVGKHMLELSCGPFRHSVPIGSIEAVHARNARGWRRLYADLEIEVVTSLSGRPIAVPTGDEDELRRALGCD